MNSLGVFLGQELIRFNELIEVIGYTLTELCKAIKGEVVMSNDLEIMYSCFMFQKVPPAWVIHFIILICFNLSMLLCLNITRKVLDTHV